MVEAMDLPCVSNFLCTIEIVFALAIVRYVQAQAKRSEGYYKSVG